MLLLIACRNIFRNKLRSLVVMLSVATGLWAGLVVMSFSYGMYQGHISNVILYQLSHLQVHQPAFTTEMDWNDTITGSLMLEQKITSDVAVKSTVRRAMSRAMIVAPSGSSGVMLIGTDPMREKEVTGLNSMIKEGTYFLDSQKKEMLMGLKLAEKLHLKLKSKVVVMMQGADGEMVSDAFRVTGIFRSRNSVFDESNVYVERNQLSRLSGSGDVTHELAVLLKSDSSLASVQKRIVSMAPADTVQNWMQLSPELDLIVNSFDTYMYIFMGIILLALMFGIVNTMLMAVLERQREIGMLMSIGMNKRRVFGMVIFETIGLSVISGPVGILLGHLTITWYSTRGIDLSGFSDALATYGFSNVIYLNLDTTYYLPVLSMTIIVAVLSAIYPAYKALKLDPSQAIRKI